MGFEVVKSDCIRDRRDFGALANYHEADTAAEIGIDRGEFTEHFLRQWRGSQYYMIDTWQPYGSSDGRGFPWDRTHDMQMAFERIKPHMERVRILRMESAQAAKSVRQGVGLGFVYLDADHSYEAVKRDIDIWWPLVRSGGILAGHDYTERFSGLQRAVNEFGKREGLRISLTHEPGASWYVRKP